jgi:replicative DNA helicase
MEMSKLQIAQRMLCSHAQIDLKRLRHGKLSDAEKTKLKLICGNMRNYKLFIDDTPGMSVMELRAKARRRRTPRHQGRFRAPTDVAGLEGNRSRDSYQPRLKSQPAVEIPIILARSTARSKAARVTGRG